MYVRLCLGVLLNYRYTARLLLAVHIYSRINITTFFNFPDMFRWYIRDLQCYIF